MKHEMWYDSEKDILFLKFTNNYVITDVPDIKKKMIELLEGKPYRQLILEISKKHKVVGRDTREQSNKALQEAEISEAAFVGGSAANRMIAKVLLKTGALKTKGDFFESREDAINWILSKR